jgi:hypothetical protein
MAFQWLRSIGTLLPDMFGSIIYSVCFGFLLLLSVQLNSLLLQLSAFGISLKVELQMTKARDLWVLLSDGFSDIIWVLSLLEL